MKKIILTVFSALSLSAFSQWNTNNSINTGVAVVPKSQNSVHTVSDGNGGIVMAWDDNRNSATTQDDIYAQRLNKSGIRKWTLYGTSICNSAGVQKNSSIVDADNGSAIIVWEDNRNGNYDIYAQKIDSSGNILWATNGVAVCNKTTTQKSPKIVGDNAGGAIIVWEDSLNFYWDIYAQRISSSGTLLWSSGGVSICSASNTQANPRVDEDGLGGAIFTWQDKRNNTDYDIYAQRINSSGVVQWATNGVVICNSINTQSNPRIEPDGSNGALIGWMDKRNGLDNNIYIQRINSSGVVQWTTNGVSVCSATNNQSALDMKYIGTSGIVLSWKDDRASANAIYSQLVSLSGVPQLTSNGIQLSNSLKSLSPNVISDGNGGAIVAWQDSTILGWDIVSQKIDSNGNIVWNSGGKIVSSANDDQQYVSQVSDGNGGAIYAWEDRRNGSDNDIYAHHLYDNGTEFVGLKELSSSNIYQSICFPNPISSNSKIQIINNKLNKDWEITVLDAFGSIVNKSSLNSNQVFDINANNYNAGIYFYFVSLKEESTVVKGSFTICH
ncbi:MAG: T9SS type A sorting domain-containing protein [Bacteroidia bacterium]